MGPEVECCARGALSRPQLGAERYEMDSLHGVVREQRLQARADRLRESQMVLGRNTLPIVDAAVVLGGA